MKIEAGKYYRTRDGRKAGPVAISGDSSYPWLARVDTMRVFQADGTHGSPAVARERGLDLVAAWTEEPAVWLDMTPEEKGAVLLAKHEDRPVDYWNKASHRWETLKSRSGDLYDKTAYRVKPEPTVELVNLHWTNQYRTGVTLECHPCDTHLITFNVVNGEPDCDSIKMEPLV